MLGLPVSRFAIRNGVTAVVQPAEDSFLMDSLILS